MACWCDGMRYNGQHVWIRLPRLYLRLVSRAPQEEEEQNYEQLFPDFFRGFQDLEALEGEGPVDDDRRPVDEHERDVAGEGASDATAVTAQATTAAAASLLHGEVLADLVALHARCVHASRSARCKVLAQETLLSAKPLCCSPTAWYVCLTPAVLVKVGHISGCSSSTDVLLSSKPTIGKRRLHAGRERGQYASGIQDDGHLAGDEAAAAMRAFDQGAALLAAVGGALPATVDRACAGGHLMRVALEHRRLNRPANSLQAAPGMLASDMVLGCSILPWSID